MTLAAAALVASHALAAVLAVRSDRALRRYRDARRRRRAIERMDATPSRLRIEVWCSDPTHAHPHPTANQTPTEGRPA